MNTPLALAVAGIAGALCLAPAPDGRAAAAPKKPAARPAGHAAKPAADGRLLTFDTCVRVIEGDQIEGKKVGAIRLIGVIAPGAGEPGCADAIAATRRLAAGKQIKLEICPERPNDDKKRIRAVVYLPDGTNLNTKLLRIGVAKVLDRKPCHIDAGEWQRYQDAAEEAKTGLWAAPGSGAKRRGSEAGAAKRPASGTRPTRPRVRIRPRG